MENIVVSPHPSEELLEKYALHQLTEQQLAPLEEHLLVCFSCQRTLEGVDEYVEIMKQAAQANLRQLEIQGRRAPRTPQWRFPVPLWAGALAVLVLGVLVSRQQVPWRDVQHGGGVPVSTITLVASRGASSMPIATGHVGGPVVLKIDLKEIAPESRYWLQLVDSKGQDVWHSSTQPSEGQLIVSIPANLSAGKYWVRLHDGSTPPVLLREYGLELQ